MQVPRATYRLQFNEHFRLADALALVPYLHELGVSHIYASPLFQAAPHSAHGYDVCDFSRLNPELGTEADLERLAAALHERNMGLVLDIVPNHMGIAARENGWWWDVLKHGRASRFAGCFDIDWKSDGPEASGKIVIPVLGGEYEALLPRGEFQILPENGDVVLGYHEHRFPLAAKTVAQLPADAAALKKVNADFAALDRLIRRQHYQLEFHARGDARLNYRRFFAISTLAAVRAEEEKVFQATHELVGRWLERGWVDGLRVDHVDGLQDPEKYLQRLRAFAPKAWIVIEKILEPDESLPEAWPVAGTTGYDFLNRVNGLFIDPAGEKVLTDFYAEFTGETTDYAAVVRRNRRAALKTLFAAELNRLTAILANCFHVRWGESPREPFPVRLVSSLAPPKAGPAPMVAVRKDLAPPKKAGLIPMVADRKVPSAELTEALAEIIVCFPVYRSYISAKTGATAPADIAAVKAAVHLACEERKDLAPELFAGIHALLLKPQRGKAAQDFVARFQQLTGPVMAKGVEDTAFYCFNRFASLNEVGGDPGRFGTGLEAFHDFMRQARRPHSQLASSTHDTKRSEDVRARLNALSEMPEVWTQTVRRWSAMNDCHRQNHLPDRNAEYLFYQTLAGAWPLPVDRAQAYMEKAAHEAKQHTSWTNRHAAYEHALQNFIAESLRDPEFTTDLEHLTGTLATAAAVNSLAQTLVKLTAPGVPDIYQGCELWDFSLVDPDNRRPVDFSLRQRLLEEAQSLSAEKAWARRAEGVPKLWLIQKTLKWRAAHPDFSNWDYQAVFARGAKAENVIAFSRGGMAITIVPRFWLKLKGDWQDTAVDLPAGSWRNEFTGDVYQGEIRMDNLFRVFPVALLARKENG